MQIPEQALTGIMSSPARSSQMSITPAIRKTSYDPVKDFAPISVVGTNPKVLAVQSGMPVKSLAEFVDHVRAQPLSNDARDAVGTPAGPEGTSPELAAEDRQDHRASISHLSTVLFLKGDPMKSVGREGATRARSILDDELLPERFAATEVSTSLRVCMITIPRRCP
jgi:hypothetical protein